MSASSSTCSWVSMPERGGDVDVDRRADRRDALAHLRHQPLVRPAHGGHDAELRRAGRRGLDGGLHQRRDVQPGRAHRRGEQAGLRAEVAVLGAAAGLDRDDALDLDLGAAPAHPHLVGEGEQRRAGPRRAAGAPSRTCASSRPRPSSSTCARGADVVDGRRSVSGRDGTRGSLPHRRRRPATDPGRPARRAGTRGASSAPAPARQRAGERPGRRASRGRGCCCGRPGRARPARRR